MDNLASNAVDGAAPVASGAAAVAVAALWRACREAEGNRKALEVLLQAEKQARIAERLTLLTRLETVTQRAGQPSAASAHPPVLQQQSPPPAAKAVASAEAAVQTIAHRQGQEALPRPLWREVLDVARLAAEDGTEVRRHCAAQLLNASGADEAARRLEERLADLISVCTGHGAASTSTSPVVSAEAEAQGCRSSGNQAAAHCPEAPPSLLDAARSCPVSPIELTDCSLADGREAGSQSESPCLSPAAWLLSAEGTSASSTQWRYHSSHSSPSRPPSTPRVRSRSVSFASMAQKSSAEISSPLEASLLTPLAQTHSISCLDDRSSRSFRAHSLSYSGEKAAETPQVPILGTPWSDDAALVRKLRQYIGCHGLCRPASGMDALRGRWPAPPRSKSDMDSMHRLPEFVGRRLQKARARSTGTWVRC